MYRELKEFATSAIDQGGHVTATIVVAQIIRLHQLLCGFVVDEEGNIHDVPESRTKELVRILTDHSGKAIIWTAYDHCIHRLTEALTKEFGEGSVARFWGGNRSTRAQEERRWKTDPECRWMIATPGAGGMGNTWTQANLVIYHSSTNNLEHRQQSEDRAHRDGQTQAVTYIDMISRGTVDEKIVRGLRKKIDIATLITGENYREWLI